MRQAQTDLLQRLLLPPLVPPASADIRRAVTPKDVNRLGNTPRSNIPSFRVGSPRSDCRTRGSNSTTRVDHDQDLARRWLPVRRRALPVRPAAIVPGVLPLQLVPA